MPFCSLYGKEPCLGEVHGPALREQARHLDIKELGDSECRKRLYRFYTRIVHGYLGRGNRIPTPHCVRALVRSIFPSPDGTHVGYHDS